MAWSSSSSLSFMWAFHSPSYGCGQRFLMSFDPPSSKLMRWSTSYCPGRWDWMPYSLYTLLFTDLRTFLTDLAYPGLQSLATDTFTDTPGVSFGSERSEPSASDETNIAAASLMKPS